MSIGMLIARFLHILFGVFWAGTLIFNALYLGPAMSEAGPDAAKVMAGIQKRRFMDVMPVVALITVLSGLWMYWRISGGFNPAWSKSPTGIAYGVGGLLAIIALGIGVGILRPTMMRIGRTAAEAGQTTDPAQRERLMATLPALRQRSAAAGRSVAILLTFTVVLMALARYL